MKPVKEAEKTERKVLFWTASLIDRGTQSIRIAAQFHRVN